MAFQGYLIKCGTTEIPSKFINEKTFVATPNMRFEKKAQRDANVLLHRVTSPNVKQVISFQTTPMNEAEKTELLNIFKNAYTIEIQRKLPISYWNIENGEYKNANCYIADIEYTIRQHTDNDVFYEPFTVNFVEY